MLKNWQFVIEKKYKFVGKCEIIITERYLSVKKKKGNSSRANKAFA
jgi:hypothetical protein